MGFSGIPVMKSIREKVNAFLDDPKKRRLLITGATAGLVIVLLAILVPRLTGPGYPDELYIDSTATPVSALVRDINIDRPYYNKKVKAKTISFYRKNENKTRWLEYDGPTGFYETYVDAIEDAEKYGLNPDHYDLKNIRDELTQLFKNKQREPEDIAQLDVRITASVLLFTTHLIEGRIRYAGYGEVIWNKHEPAENDVDLLLANSSGKLSDIFEALHPDHEQYEKLRKALDEYRKCNNTYRIKLTAGAATITPGEHHPGIPGIRRRLSLTDCKPYSPEDSLHYDDKLVDAVKQFQRRHGLEADGIIGSTTHRYLNQSLEYKTDLIELNLERLRWRPKKYGPDYISINIPEFMLRVFKNGKKKMEMKVVLGTEYNSTPVFSDTIEYIVFSPTWNVPASITEEEFIPKLREDPEHFDPERFIIYRNGEKVDPTEIDWEDDDLEIDEFRIVENPGDMNSLGLVKFMFPNKYNIYLHDTPAERLFNENKRAYSHGCIRLEKPVDLARFLLDENDLRWKDDEIREAMSSEEPRDVPLKERYPVEIEYRTVWVDDDGLVNFREDIYEHDKRQLALLKRID